jgi:hypothetical protein
LKRCEDFVSDDVQSDVASLRLIDQSGERLVWIAAVLRYQGSFGHVDLWSRGEPLRLQKKTPTRTAGQGL